MEKTLIWFSENYGKFTPNDWALKNIPPETSTRKLYTLFKTIEEAEGGKWTYDLLSKVNRPELSYLRQGDAKLMNYRAALIENFSKPSNEAAILQFLKEITPSSD